MIDESTNFRQVKHWNESLPFLRIASTDVLHFKAGLEKKTGSVKLSFNISENDFYTKSYFEQASKIKLSHITGALVKDMPDDFVLDVSLKQYNAKEYLNIASTYTSKTDARIHSELSISLEKYPKMTLDKFYIDESYQGTGIVATTFRNLAPIYDALNITETQLEAIDTGRYVWGKYGAVMDKSSWSNVIDAIFEHVSDNAENFRKSSNDIKFHEFYAFLERAKGNSQSYKTDYRELLTYKKMGVYDNVAFELLVTKNLFDTTSNAFSRIDEDNDLFSPTNTYSTENYSTMIFDHKDTESLTYFLNKMQKYSGKQKAASQPPLYGPVLG